MPLLAALMNLDFAGSPVILVTTPFVVFDARPRAYLSTALAHDYLADAEGAPVVMAATSREFVAHGTGRRYLFPATQRTGG